MLQQWEPSKVRVKPEFGSDLQMVCIAERESIQIVTKTIRKKLHTLEIKTLLQLRGFNRSRNEFHQSSKSGLRTYLNDASLGIFK